MINTTANIYCKIFDLNFNEPKYAPQIPPTKATATYIYMSVLKLIPFCNCAIKPDSEFTNMNKALIAAVCFMFAHFNSNKTGDKIIPPPIPIKPERKPIEAPIRSDK